MQIGQKLRELREEKGLSQGHIKNKTGLLRWYLSRVENGYTVPNVETPEKFARALEISLYRFFTDGEKVSAPKLPLTRADEGQINGKDRHKIRQFARALKRMDERKQKLLLGLAQEMARRRTRI